MTDREKVLKGLECCVYSDDEGVCPDECPYYTDCWDGDRDSLDFLLKKDALELLRKQPKPMAAHWVRMKGMMPEYCGHFECDNCGWHGKPLMREIDFAYCPGCGAKMSIDGLHAEDCKKTPFDQMIDDYLEATGGVVDV